MRIWAGWAMLAGLLLVGSPAQTASSEHAWAGSWAMELRVASVARMPLLAAQRSVTVSHMLVDLERGRDGWTQRHRVCGVRVETSSSRVRMAIPRAFVRSLPERSYPVSFRGTPSGWSYRADLGVETIGLEPGFDGAELPRSPDHPAVEDTDGDGEPGATVELFLPVVGRARLFIVQRSHLILSGRGSTDGGLQGTVEIREQRQSTVGAEPGMFRRSPTIRPDAERSRFTLARIPAGTTCVGLQSIASELFLQAT